MTHKIIALIGVVVISTTIWACKKDKVLNPTVVLNAMPKAEFQIRMTDDPANYSEVNIDLLQVRVKIQDSSWYDLATNQGIYNLLDYQNGLDTAIASDSLPSLAVVNEIRLILGPNNTVVKDSVSYPLTTPSAQQSGIKIKLSQIVYGDSLNTVIIDFDAAKSVKVTGNNKHMLHPVIKVL